jgi:hypothetical protein
MRERFASWSAQRLQPNAIDARELHLQLAAFNARRLRPGMPSTDWRRELHAELALRELEGDYVEASRVAVEPWLNELPADAQRFMQWFEALQETGPGQHDALFAWLAEQATMPQMRWFLEQEIGGEAGFDDLVALTQIRLPAQAKMELARNYWDEMGRGSEAGMHGGMLLSVAQELGLQARPESTVWESLALANLMAALAATRRYAYLSVGALGVVELTAPGRVSLVNEGLRRLGVSAEGRRYFQLHAGLDVRHSEAWNREAILPLVSADPALMQPIAEGALMRLRCGAACFERYRREFGLG